VDDELRLWVDEKLIDFAGPTTFDSPENVLPVSNSQDPGDLAPVGVGVKGAQVHVNYARILRDVYYIATNSSGRSEYEISASPRMIREVMADSRTWSTTQLFLSRRSEEFMLAHDQFFPMGDNSPQSKDARMWSDSPSIPPYVERDLLTGKAVFVYWPHPLARPLPYLPNIGKMRLIR
jgi:signal peptidase I